MNLTNIIHVSMGNYFVVINVISENNYERFVMPKKFFLKLKMKVVNFNLNHEENKPFEFKYKKDSKLTVLLRKPNEEETEIGHKKEDPFCIATCEYDFSDELVNMLNNVKINNLPKENCKKYLEMCLSKKLELENNNIQPLFIFPKEFVAFSNENQDKLRNYIVKTINILSWRQKVLLENSPFSFSSYQWSCDKINWHRMPQSIVVYSELVPQITKDKKVFNEITNYVENDVNIPVGHELFREAWHLRHSNPRSSLVIGIAAAEAGFKNFVLSVVPETKWLLENIQSPPLKTMLEKYLETLPVKKSLYGKVQQPPKNILKLIGEGVTLRNKIVHTGKDAPRYGTLVDILNSVQDLLWMLDYYSGHEWAKKYIRYETLLKMKPSVKKEKNKYKWLETSKVYHKANCTRLNRTTNKSVKFNPNPPENRKPANCCH